MLPINLNSSLPMQSRKEIKQKQKGETERQLLKKMKNLGILHNQLPLLAMIFAQFAYAGMFLLLKAAISSGLKPAIFITYRQASAAAALAPFAFYCDRRSSPLTWRLLGQIFIASTLGLHMSLNLLVAAVNNVSATYNNAIFNLVPLFVFIIAVIFRMEKLAISERQRQAKIIGILLALGGAAIFSFYTGPPLYPASQHHNAIARSYTKEQTIKGCLLAISGNVVFAIWIIMQGPIIKVYKANFKFMALQCFFGSITTGIYGVAVERNASSWKLGWNLQLVTILYCGIVLTGIGFTLQVWAVGKKGPVYPVIFNPLSLILTAFVSAVVFHETLHVGSVLGSFFLVAGLYSFVWAKKTETGKQQVEKLKEEAQLESIVTSNTYPETKENQI